VLALANGHNPKPPLDGKGNYQFNEFGWDLFTPGTTVPNDGRTYSDRGLCGASEYLSGVSRDATTGTVKTITCCAFKLTLQRTHPGGTPLAASAVAGTNNRALPVTARSHASVRAPRRALCAAHDRASGRRTAARARHGHRLPGGDRRLIRSRGAHSADPVCADRLTLRL
jgi:hypothetical protein